MKTTRLITFAFTILVTFISVHAQTDLSMREALYFTGAKTESIDLKNDKYVAKGATIHVGAEMAKSCDMNTCQFNVGFIGFRSGNTASALMTYGLISHDGGSSLFGNELYFAPSATTRQGIVPVKLKLGQNKLTFTIDPYKKAAETNERNNTFSVTVIVNAAGRQSGAAQIDKVLKP